MTSWSYNLKLVVLNISDMTKLIDPSTTILLAQLMEIVKLRKNIIYFSRKLFLLNY